MFKLTKESAVNTVLDKRFGITNPEEVENLNEINIWYSADNEITELGISVELKFDNQKDENYQVNSDGIVYSWGDSPIIDEKSQNVKLSLEKVSKNYDSSEDDLEDEE